MVKCFEWNFTPKPNNMQNTIYLVTKNESKLKVAQNALKVYGITVDQVAIDTLEIQSSSVEEVVKYSVQFAANKVGKPVIKGDVGFSVEALGGFPGPFIKFVNKWITPQQFINLYKNETNKKAYFTDALGYCEPGGEPVCFVTKTYGTLSERPTGDNGNTVDSLFIPDGFATTIASLTEEEYLKLWSNDRYKQLSEYLKKE